jgi:F-type H+-transporting ATPase subunit b
MTLFSILAASNPVTDIAEQFGVDWWKFISQCISFTIVAWVLAKYAYNPILNVLEERRKKIEEGLANAQEIKKQLAAAQEQATQLLSKAGTDAQKVIDEAKAAAKSIVDRETARATTEANQIVAKAREEAQRDRAAEFANLKRELSRLVVTTTARVTGKVLSEDDQKRLSEEASKELAA